MLGGMGNSTNILANKLLENHSIELMIFETSPDKLGILKKRLKKLGLLTVINQLLFQTFGMKLLKLLASKRRSEIMTTTKFDESIPNTTIKYVDSVNSDETFHLLSSINPELVIVNGTRIIEDRILEIVDAKFINTHVGITPKYRGVHGAYWALVNNDLENCGVTLHYIDSGIDTGKVIAQSRIHVTPRDNFTTYPLLQLQEGIVLLERVINNFMHGKDLFLSDFNTPKEKLYLHPTLTQYIYNRFKGIK